MASFIVSRWTFNTLEALRIFGRFASASATISPNSVALWGIGYTVNIAEGVGGFFLVLPAIFLPIQGDTVMVFSHAWQRYFAWCIPRSHQLKLEISQSSMRLYKDFSVKYRCFAPFRVAQVLPRPQSRGRCFGSILTRKFQFSN